MTKRKIGILVSGRGSNFQAVADKIKKENLPIEIAVVISDSPEAYALERAEKMGIPHYAIARQDYVDKPSFEAAIDKTLREAGVELVVLAGFLVAIPPMIVEAFPNRIINIHPSLIPAFCGVGFYGLHVHKKALERGVRVTGATVHFVDTGTDTGPIILQKAVKIKQGDTPEILQRRVMEKAEWKILPKAINLIANGKVSVEDGKVRIS